MNGFHSDRGKPVALFLFWLLDCVLCFEDLPLQSHTVALLCSLPAHL